MNVTDTIGALIGDALSSVNFVADYVEFDFNGPRLASIADPFVRIHGEKEVRFPQPNSRDALCGFIGRKLVDLRLMEGVSIELVFDTGQILIPLGRELRVTPEAAIFIPAPDRPVQVFE